MKRQSVLLALCIVLLAGCSLPTVGALTPEQAAQQMAGGLDGKPDPMQVLGKRTLSNGMVMVLHRSTHQSRWTTN